MITILAANIIISWMVKASTTYKACIKLPTDTVFSCVTPSGTGNHAFTNLLDDTSYVFAITENTVESHPITYKTQKKTPDAPVIQQLPN